MSVRRPRGLGSATGTGETCGAMSGCGSRESGGGMGDCAAIGSSRLPQAPQKTNVDGTSVPQVGQGRVATEASCALADSGAGETGAPVDGATGVNGGEPWYGCDGEGGVYSGGCGGV